MKLSLRFVFKIFLYILNYYMGVITEENNTNRFSRFWSYSCIAVLTQECTDEKGIPEDSICHNPVIDFYISHSFLKCQTKFYMQWIYFLSFLARI